MPVFVKILPQCDGQTDEWTISQGYVTYYCS